MKSISINDLNEALKTITADDLVLDVRTPMEFAEGRVPGAANIPVDQVMIHAEELKKFKKIYIYCKAGVRAETAAHILDSMGVQNIECIDDGGFPNWEHAGFAIETG